MFLFNSCDVQASIIFAFYLTPVWIHSFLSLCVHDLFYRVRETDFSNWRKFKRLSYDFPFDILTKILKILELCCEALCFCFGEVHSSYKTQWCSVCLVRERQFQKLWGVHQGILTIWWQTPRYSGGGCTCLLFNIYASWILTSQTFGRNIYL